MRVIELTKEKYKTFLKKYNKVFTPNKDVTFYIGVEDYKGELICSAEMIQENNKAITPNGPILDWSRIDLVEIFTAIRKYLKKKKIKEWLFNTKVPVSAISELNKARVTETEYLTTTTYEINTKYPTAHDLFIKLTRRCQQAIRHAQGYGVVVKEDAGNVIVEVDIAKYTDNLDVQLIQALKEKAIVDRRKKKKKHQQKKLDDQLAEIDRRIQILHADLTQAKSFKQETVKLAEGSFKDNGNRIVCQNYTTDDEYKYFNGEHFLHWHMIQKCIIKGYDKYVIEKPSTTFHDLGFGEKTPEKMKAYTMPVKRDFFKRTKSK